MDQTERLALAVTTQVAMIRADQARDRAALLGRWGKPYIEMLERLIGLLKRTPVPSNVQNAALLVELMQTKGASVLHRDELEAAEAAGREALALTTQAAEAMQMLSDQWRVDDRDQSLYEWVGCTEAEYVTALIAALVEVAPSPPP